MSLHCLGAEPPARGILIKVNNARALAAKEGGAAGAVAATLVPETIESVVLEKMVAQFRESLRDKGVDADVAIVAAAGQQPVKSGFNAGVLTGAGLAGAGWAVWHYGLSRFL